ncbi:MAG: hypothetical protein WBL35_01870 [Ornithinibacter sp.]
MAPARLDGALRDRRHRDRRRAGQGRRRRQVRRDPRADTIEHCLNAGLLDELHIDLAALLLGSGVRLFDHLAAAPAVLGNPTVTRGVDVTHLRYPVGHQGLAQ